MNLFIVAAILVSIAAFFDQFTTQLCIKAGDIEANQVLDWLYRTNKPTPLQGYGFSVLAIAAEISLYLALYHFFGLWIGVGIILLSAETAVHVACAISNYKLVKTGKALFVL
jgi:hypothetical protein